MNKSIRYLKTSLRWISEHPSFDSLSSIVKYYGQWMRYLGPDKNPIHEEMAWLCFSSIDFIEKRIRPDMTVYEYGSGGSTLFWASRVRTVISVEHDKAWFENVKQMLHERKILNVEYHLVEPQEDKDYMRKSFANADDYISSDKDFVGKNFERYAKSIELYSDKQFDIIVVDGRARPSCILHALKKLKHNGYLIVDNTERHYYLNPFDLPSQQWLRWDFSGPVPFSYSFSQTTIFKKK